MKILHIELDLIGTKQDGDEVSTEEIKDAIISNESEFMERMAVLCSKSETRASLLEDTIAVEDICLSGNGGVASVVFEYEAYYGCKDADHSGEIQDDWEFDIIENKIVFDLEVPDLFRDDEI